MKKEKNTVIAPIPCSTPVPEPWGITGTQYAEHNLIILQISSTELGYVTISGGKDLKNINNNF